MTVPGGRVDVVVAVYKADLDIGKTGGLIKESYNKTGSSILKSLIVCFIVHTTSTAIVDGIRRTGDTP